MRQHIRKATIIVSVCSVAIAISCRQSDASSSNTIRITAHPSQTHAISPYIYGINLAGSIDGLPKSLSLDRSGGNRWTAYNWESNASNAGSDYRFENDSYLGKTREPGGVVTQLIKQDRKLGMASIMTVQMQGLVAADEDGPVAMTKPPDMTRFKTVVFEKRTNSIATFTVTPPTDDAYVYMDEFLWAIDQQFPAQRIFTRTESPLPVFVQLDNEPELWNSTHREIQGANRVTSDAFISKTISLATALKTEFKDLVLFGPGNYGFFGLFAWDGEISASALKDNWFVDKYLAAINRASAKAGVPLVDVYDFHWYPEARDGRGRRITTLNNSELTDDSVQAIVQSPRSLWDPGYREDSWIVSTLGEPISILPRIQRKIARENPGMRISVTEYNNGGAKHIAGTIAQADDLGVFGAENLFAAALWPVAPDEPYVLAGFRAFRNFDGEGHNFGDRSVEADSSNTANVAAYISTDSTRPGRVVIVAINRSNSPQQTTVNGQPLQGTAHLFQMTAQTAKTQREVAPVEAGTLSISSSTISLTLPSLSVTTIDVY